MNPRPTFQPYDTSTRLAVVESHLADQDDKLDRVIDKVDALHSDFNELRLELAKRRSSPPFDGLQLSRKTLILLCGLAMSVGGGVVTIVKLFFGQ